MLIVGVSPFVEITGWESNWLESLIESLIGGATDRSLVIGITGRGPILGVIFGGHWLGLLVKITTQGS